MNGSSIIYGFDVYVALRRAGWRVKRYYRSLRILELNGRPDFTYDSVLNATRIGPRMLARVGKHTGLAPGDVQAFVAAHNAGRSGAKHTEVNPGDL